MSSNFHHFERTDFQWLILFPIFAVFQIFIHEISHAITAVLKGGNIIDIVIIPHLKNGRFVLPYCKYSAPSSWMIKAAPFIVDTVLIATGLIIIKKIRLRSHKLWLIISLMMIWMPFGEMLINYLMGVFTFFKIISFPAADVSKLFLLIPPWVVHLSFICVIGICGWQISKIFIGK